MDFMNVSLVKYFNIYCFRLHKLHQLEKIGNEQSLTQKQAVNKSNYAEVECVKAENKCQKY